ncbi:MAG: hypothetical protein LC687_07780, partial [Actinobacteria bacterium]|nr:hypothetical protein [Actinomycetota bacterium]
PKEETPTPDERITYASHRGCTHTRHARCAAHEPVFTNPISGQAASSVFAVLVAMGYNCRGAVGGDS